MNAAAHLCLAALLLSVLSACGHSQKTVSANVHPEVVPPAVPDANGVRITGLVRALRVYSIQTPQIAQIVQGAGPQGQYYRSKNGGIYYRDAQHRVHWVTAPQQPIEVPAEEYHRYTGRDPNAYGSQVIRQAPAGW